MTLAPPLKALSIAAMAIASFLILAPLVSPQTTFDLPLVWSSDPDVRGFVQSKGNFQVVTRTIGEVFIQEKDGTVSWSAPLPPTGPGFGWRIAVLEDGRYILLTVTAENDASFPGEPGLAGTDLGLVCFDPQQNELWRRRVGTGNDELGGSLELDGNGGIYVVSQERDPAVGPASYGGLGRLSIHRLDGAGNTLWGGVPLMPGPPTEDTRSWDTSSNVHSGFSVCARSVNPFDPVFDSHMVVRFRPDGTRVYAVSAPGQFREPYAMDAQGAVYAGYVEDLVGAAERIHGAIGLDPSGATRWNDRSLCVSLFLGFDQMGQLWARANEQTTFPVCDSFGLGAADEAKLHRVSPATGQILESLDVPQDFRGLSSVLEMYMTPGGHILARSATAQLNRLASDLPAAAPTCAGVPNSTGSAAELRATGAESRAEGDLTLFAGELPPQVTTLFITAFASGFLPAPGGSDGNLCLSGPIGRFSRAGELRTATAAGRVALALDLDAIPTPNARIALAPGQTIFFQAWYRDSTPLPTSNFTSAISVTLN